MFYNLLSTRAIRVGIAFFVLVVGGSLLYSWNTHRTTESDLARHDRFTRELEKPSETRPAENVNDPTKNETPGFLKTPDETTDTPMPDETGTEVLPLVDAFLPEAFASAEEIPAEEVPVSPYGFGPYPEVPAGYPLAQSIPWEWSEEDIAASKKTMEKILQAQGVSFTQFLKTNELMARVGIKLWNEGRRFDGITTSNQTGLFYPNEPGVLYVKWREAIGPDGDVRRYMSKTIGSAISNVSIAAQEGREPPPDSIEIRSLNDGIDPYDFLDLNR